MSEDGQDLLHEPMTGREAIVHKALREDSYVRLWLDPDDAVILAKLMVRALDEYTYREHSADEYEWRRGS